MVSDRLNALKDTYFIDIDASLMRPSNRGLQRVVVQGLQNSNTPAGLNSLILSPLALARPF